MTIERLAIAIATPPGSSGSGPGAATGAPAPDPVKVALPGLVHIVAPPLKEPAPEQEPRKKEKPEPVEPKLGTQLSAPSVNQLNISHNDEVDRFVYRGVNPETKQVESQYPSDADLARIAALRALASRVLDKSI